MIKISVIKLIIVKIILFSWSFTNLCYLTNIIPQFSTKMRPIERYLTMSFFNLFVFQTVQNIFDKDLVLFKMPFPL